MPRYLHLMYRSPAAGMSHPRPEEHMLSPLQSEWGLEQDEGGDPGKVWRKDHIARWLEDCHRESRPPSGMAPQAPYRSLHYSEVTDYPMVFGRRAERLGMHFTLTSLWSTQGPS